jgi:hypothetical protein
MHIKGECKANWLVYFCRCPLAGWTTFASFAFLLGSVPFCSEYFGWACLLSNYWQSGGYVLCYKSSYVLYFLLLIFVTAGVAGCKFFLSFEHVFFSLRDRGGYSLHSKACIALISWDAWRWCMNFRFVSDVSGGDVYEWQNGEINDCRKVGGGGGGGGHPPNIFVGTGFF